MWSQKRGDAQAMQPCPAFTGQLVWSFHCTEGQLKVACRSLAAHLVQAPAFAVPFIAPFGDEAAGVVMCAPLALIVDDAAIGEQGPVILIERGQIVEGQVMDQHRRGVGGIVRTAGHVDDLDAGHGLLNAQRAGGIGIRANQPAIEGAGPTAMVAAALRQTVSRDFHSRWPPMVQ